MEITEFLVMGVIAFFSMFIAVIAALFIWLKWLEDSLFLEDLAENILKNAATNEEMQKNLFMVGGLLGNGIKGGIGLQGSTKMPNLKQIGTSILGQFLQGVIDKNFVNPPSSSAPPTSLSQTQEDTVKKLSEKW